MYREFYYRCFRLNNLLRIRETWVTVFKLALPVTLIGLLSFFLYVGGKPTMKVGGLLLSYYFTPAGRLVIPLAYALGVNVWMVVIGILFIDATSSMFVIWNFSHIHKIPFVGPYLKKAHDRSEDMLMKHTWLQELTFFGIIAVVAVPFMGTNEIVGAVIGLLAGMRPERIWIAVMIGSLLGNMLMTLPLFGIGAL